MLRHNVHNFDSQILYLEAMTDSPKPDIMICQNLIDYRYILAKLVLVGQI